MMLVAVERKSRSGGRPPLAQAEAIRDDILDHATALFFEQGYGATSIEAVARSVGMSKRTFYTRFTDKADLFRAVVQRIVERLKPAGGVEPIFAGENLIDSLTQIAQALLKASLTPAALALHRLLLAEAGRFPELAAMAEKQGARQDAIERIAGLLCRKAPSAVMAEQAPFAAEQFMQMVIATPQRRALGLGQPMDESERRGWAQATVRLFLDGYRRA